MVPISKMRFHDGVSAAEHTGDAWYVRENLNGAIVPVVADGWYPVIESGCLQPWKSYIGEGDVVRDIFDGKSFGTNIDVHATRTNPDGTVTTLGLFTTKEAAEAYIKNPKEFQ